MRQARKIQSTIRPILHGPVTPQDPSFDGGVIGCQIDTLILAEMCPVGDVSETGAHVTTEIGQTYEGYEMEGNLARGMYSCFLQRRRRGGARDSSGHYSREVSRNDVSTHEHGMAVRRPA